METTSFDRIVLETPPEFQGATLANLGARCRSGLVPKKGMTSRYAESPVINGSFVGVSSTVWLYRYVAIVADANHDSRVRP